MNASEGSTHYDAVGRRKRAVARVRLRLGSGHIKVNGRPIEKYFPVPALVSIAKEPLIRTNTADKYDITAILTGGGHSGQAGAMRLGIARALTLAQSELRPILRKEGFLTRDPREKERKKYGQRGARRRFQFSKR